MIKIDLHTHSKEDPLDKMNYSIYDLIDKAVEMKFDAIAITHHNTYFSKHKEYYEKTKEYAKQKDLIIIPGIETTIENKHVLIYNSKRDIEKIKTFSELREYKKQNPNILIIAPHPFHHTSFCLKNKLIENIDLFDAIELSSFYSKTIKLNEKAISIAKQFNKPLVGNGDIHLLKTMGKTYTLVDSNKNIQSIIIFNHIF